MPQLLGGLFSFGNLYSAVLAIKHFLVLTMISVALFRNLALGWGNPTPSREKLKIGLLYLNASLGVVVLLFSGFRAAL